MELEIKTIEQLEIEVQKVLLLNDFGVVKLLCATVIANMLKLDAVWVMLVAGPSGGKSELLAMLNGLTFIHPISDLTVNTFASGFRGKPGEETSLLWKINYGIMVYKDFTSILSKNKDARKEIMGQLREIYDGKYDKETGNGKNINWTGKVGAIAGATEIIYESLGDLSAMGDRFILYSIIPPERLAVARRALDNAGNMVENRAHLQECFKSYIEYVLANVDPEKPELDPEMKEELLRVADFATNVRSAVLTDFKTGAVDFVPSKEGPARVTAQLYNLAAAFIIMKKARPDWENMTEERQKKLEKVYKDILYKVAMDSIPVKRRMALQALARYKEGVSSAGLAMLLNYPTETVRKWLSALNGLNVCERIKKRGRQGDEWRMKDEYRKIMSEFDKIEVVEGFLEDTSDDWDIEDMEPEKIVSKNAEFELEEQIKQNEEQRDTDL